MPHLSVEGNGVGESVGDRVGAGVHAAGLHGAVSLSAALQACATPAEGVVMERTRLARPDPQSTVQSLQPDQAASSQSVHVKASHGVISVSPPHEDPPKAGASITNLERDEDPAASQTAVKSHLNTQDMSTLTT